MNCLEFQRRLNADPHRLGQEAEAHAEDCPACARRLARQMRLEAELAQALLIAPPEGLADRVLLSARLGRRRERTRLFAVAAGLLVAVGIGLSLPTDPPVWGTENLPRAGIAHVLSEPQFLAVREAASRDSVATQFLRVGARLAGELPAVHAAPCEVPGGNGAHIVLETPHGRVTVLLMPNREVRGERGERGQGLIAVVHSARRGCYVLVAPNQAALDHARAMLEKSLVWT
jgi:anti-sigma factor RsiW